MEKNDKRTCPTFGPYGPSDKEKGGQIVNGVLTHGKGPSADIYSYLLADIISFLQDGQKYPQTWMCPLTFCGLCIFSIYIH